MRTGAKPGPWTSFGRSIGVKPPLSRMTTFNTRSMRSSSSSSSNMRGTPAQMNHMLASDLARKGSVPFLILDTNAMFRLFFGVHNTWQHKASVEMSVVVESADRLAIPWVVLYEMQWLQAGSSRRFVPLRHPETGKVLTAREVTQVVTGVCNVEILVPTAQAADVFRLHLTGPAAKDPWDRAIASHAYDLLETNDGAFFVTSDTCMQQCGMLRTTW